MFMHARGKWLAVLIGLVALTSSAIAWNRQYQEHAPTDSSGQMFLTDSVRIQAPIVRFARGAGVYIADNTIPLLSLAAAAGLALVGLRPRRAPTTPPTRQVDSMVRLTRTLPARPDPGDGYAEYALVVRAGGTIGAEYELAQLNTFLGANPVLVDVVLSDAYASGRHASIQREGDALYVVDVGSSNGTLLNSAPLIPHRRTPLRPTDLLTIGGLTLECIRRDAIPATAVIGEYRRTARNRSATIVLPDEDGT